MTSPSLLVFSDQLQNYSQRVVHLIDSQSSKHAVCIGQRSACVLITILNQNEILFLLIYFLIQQVDMKSVKMLIQEGVFCASTA